jgi:hypothetical protein
MIHLLEEWVVHSRAVYEILNRAKDPEKTLDAAWGTGDWVDDVAMMAMKKSPDEALTLSNTLRGGERVAYSFAVLNILGQLMESNELQYPVGEALQTYKDSGVLIVDVHSGNIGFTIKRPEYPKGILVITDPGLAVALTPEWSNVEILEV